MALHRRAAWLLPGMVLPNTGGAVVARAALGVVGRAVTLD
jgi:hypothetical protein